MATVHVKRKRTLVDSEVQGSLIRRVAMHWVVFFLCNAFALMCWIRLFEQPDADWGQTFGDTVRRFLPFFIITVALIPAFVWDTLKLSHRFAGPITRLRNTLKDMKAGRSVPPLRFRENDFWQEIASNFNDVMDLRRGRGELDAGSDSKPTGENNDA
ncbi:hypothetical protein [Roseiconus lacunae]|uniref:HAMP domain-containing protein n=1 Tax=Roseiconus lacunae TaxID=2605694 RepID=A0ABT7PLH9_9BACT|nr:hypothetical protein [Roseiconus lacunae]MCD0460874.1 hypothetical protein [Roseiconus lacunae]MDM4017370.1 hypothetical protein [Roseiconus lacunae]WRQ48719.1 hypothetical protein U8335_17320 [Stieleria sp. HD01]